MLGKRGEVGGALLSNRFLAELPNGGRVAKSGVFSTRARNLLGGNDQSIPTRALGRSLSNIKKRIAVDEKGPSPIAARAPRVAMKWRWGELVTPAHVCVNGWVVCETKSGKREWRIAWSHFKRDLSARERTQHVRT